MSYDQGKPCTQGRKDKFNHACKDTRYIGIAMIFETKEI